MEMLHNKKFIFLAKLGIVESTDEYGSFQVQRIDEPDTFAFDNGLDFIPPFLKSDLEAEQIYKGVPKQMWVQDIYDVPDGTTKEEINRLVETDDIFEFFQERDMFANFEMGGDTTETGNYEIINTEQGNN